MKIRSRIIAAILVLASAISSCKSPDYELEIPDKPLKPTVNPSPTPGGETTEIDADRLEVHPRILMNNREWDNLKAMITEGANKYLTQMHRNSLAMADQFASAFATEYKYTPTDGDCHVPHCILVNLAYAYRTTGEAKYLTAAETVLSTVAALPHWNQAIKFLNTAEIATGTAVAYDWLYNDLKPEIKEKVAAALKKQCIGAAMNDGLYDWKRNNNWAQLCCCAVAVSAIACYEDSPESMQAAIDKSISSNLTALPHMYSPDGNYVEGYSYWEYGTSFQGILNAALETTMGSDFGLNDVKGVTETGTFMTYMVGPNWRNFNFSDNHESVAPLSPIWYYAWRFKDPSILYLEIAKMSDTYLTGYASGRFLPETIFFCSKFKADDIKKPSARVWAGYGDQPLVLCHTDWSFTNTDQFLGLKGGKGSNPHGHLDAGSFVYDAYGVRWASDINHPDYSVHENVMKADGGGLWNMEANSLRWQANCYNNLCHNTVTMGGALHNPAEIATLTRVFDESNKIGGVVNMTKVFRNCKLFTREAAIIDDEYLRINDRMQMSTPADYRFSWITTASVAVQPDGITLTSGGVTMKLTATDAVGGTIQYMEHSTAPVTKYDIDLTGIHNIGFIIKDVKTADIVITLKKVN